MAVTEALMSLFLKEAVSLEKVSAATEDISGGKSSSSSAAADHEEALLRWASACCAAVKKKAGADLQDEEEAAVSEWEAIDRRSLGKQGLKAHCFLL